MEALELALGALTPAIRRQILRDMGIDVWLPRPAAGATASPPRDAPPVEVAPDEAVQRAQAPAGRAAIGRAPAGAAPTGLPRTVEPRDAEASVAVAPLAVMSIARAGAVMLIDGSPERRDLRLAMDILAATAAGARSKPVTRRFDWPPPGAGHALVQGADARRRALEAFVDKDLDDHGALLLLCTESLAAELPDRWPGCGRVVVPALHRLGRDGALKRALWHDISQVLQRLDRRVSRSAE